MRLAIADPPYPVQVSERFDTATGEPRLVTRSRARRYYGDGPREAGVTPADFHEDAGYWDDDRNHRLLLEELDASFDGWAIATCPDGLRAYHPLPPAARTLVWVKRRPQPTGHRIATSWEPVIVAPPRTRRARGGARQVPDVLTCSPPGKGFAGAKPAAWTHWVLDALGYDPDTDHVTDLFPGSGAVSAAAGQLSMRFY